MDISKIRLNGTDYTLKDAFARGEAEEAEGVSHIKIGGVDYDVKDIVARGEGSATAQEISSVSIGGKVYQIKDIVARESGYDYYFAVYSADDNSLTFYGDDSIPDTGTQYGGKTVTTVYEGVENTGLTGAPPWHDDIASFKSVMFDASFSGARPTSCYSWFRSASNCTAIDGLGNLNTSAVTTMGYMLYNCVGLTTLDVSNWDTSNVTNMQYMFYDCSRLTTIYSDDAKFITTKVTSGGSMFTACPKLVGGNGTAYNSSNVTYTMAHVDTASNPGYFTGK